MSPARFSWSATCAASIVAVGTTLALLLLGAGAGLVLLPEQGGTPQVAPGYFTLGAIYFLAAQAFGMAVGGHAVGRMIGPQIETANEENFRAGVHGLAVWALTVLITLVVVALTGSLAEKSTMRLGVLYGTAADATNNRPAIATEYFVDALFRPQDAYGRHASLDGVQFAQANTQQGTDAAPTPLQSPGAGDGSQQMPSAPSDTEVQGGQSNPPLTADQTQTLGNEPGSRVVRHLPGDLAPPTPQSVAPNPVQLAADKAEVARMLDAAAARGEFLSVDERERIAELVAQDANISYEAATSRVNATQGKLRDARATALSTARRLASFAALWLAASFIFGAVVCVVAAISARWEDDMQTMFAFVRTRKQ
jgi:hypothetical protein